MTPISRRDVLRAAAAFSVTLAPAALAPVTPLFAWQAPAQEPKYSSDVDVVNILATVLDKEGRVAPNLTQDDFSIEEDGRPQTIRYFARQFNSPLTLGLLVDTSGSERRNIQAERRASYKFFEQVLREDQDKAFLIHFDWQVELVQDLTSTRRKLEQGLDTVKESDQPSNQQTGAGRGGRGGAGTLLYDAVFLAGDEVMHEPAVTKTQGRRAVVLFSDGEDQGSKTSLSSAIEAAQRADTLVYSVRFYDPKGNLGFGGGRRGRRGGGFPGGGSGRPDREDGKKVLQRISSETGGAYFEVSGGTTLEKIYARIQDQLRNQYSLGYTSDQHGAGYRMIKVAARGKNLTVQAREGYYAR